MNNLSLFDKFKNFVAKHYGNGAGKMLVHTGAIGWILSSLAQISAIALNDNIPKKQKMFLIPQEMADAAVNIASFYTITQSFQSIGSKLVSTGRWLPKDTRTYLNKMGVKNVGSSTFDVLRDGMLSPKAKSKYIKFKSGIDIVVTTIGSIIASNIITPILRNNIAAKQQKYKLDKINQPYDNISIVKPNSVEYFQRPTMQYFMSHSNQNLKI